MSFTPGVRRTRDSDFINTQFGQHPPGGADLRATNVSWSTRPRNTSLSVAVPRSPTLTVNHDDDDSEDSEEAAVSEGDGDKEPPMPPREAIIRLGTGVLPPYPLPPPQLDAEGFTGEKTARRKVMTMIANSTPEPTVRLRRLRRKLITARRKAADFVERGGPGGNGGDPATEVARLDALIAAREKCGRDVDGVRVRHGTVHGKPVTIVDPSAVLNALRVEAIGHNEGAIERWCEPRYRARQRDALQVMQDCRDDAVNDLTDLVDGRQNNMGTVHTIQRLHSCAPYVTPERLMEELNRVKNGDLTITPVSRYYGISRLVAPSRQNRAFNGKPTPLSPTSGPPPLERAAIAARHSDPTRVTTIDRQTAALERGEREPTGAVARRPADLGAIPFIVKGDWKRERERPIRYGSKRWHDLVHGQGTLPLPGETRETCIARDDLHRAYAVSPQ